MNWAIVARTQTKGRRGTGGGRRGTGGDDSVIGERPEMNQLMNELSGMMGLWDDVASRNRKEIC